VQAVNEGAFWLQHRDHGLETGWGEPAVRNSHVYQMTNTGKLPFVMSINCLTGKFNEPSDCFAEAWMRHTSNGQNAGAVGILCPTETSYSFVNDAFVWGVYDLFDGNFMPDYGPYADNTGNWMPAFGNVAGKYFLAQSSWPYNVQDKDITYTMFTAHCDAFLRIYTQVPQEMEVTHPEVVIAGLGEITITAPQGCMISMVKENPEGGWEIIAVAEATGDPQTIVFEPQVPPTEINLVVTGQNYLRYEAVMGVIPADGPYIVYDNKVIHDQNGNNQLDFGEAIDLDIRMKNVGSDAMGAFEAVLETSSEYITITNSTAQFDAMEPNATQTIANAFSFTVADNVPDNTSNHFTITVTNGDDAYVSNLSIKAYAPVFNLGGMSITEVDGNGNGRLDAGETARLSFPIENRGHADAAATTAVMHILSPYITVEETTVEFEQLNAGETQTAVYAISVSEDTPTGYICDFQIEVTSGQYSTQNAYVAKVGLIIEDFESGTLGSAWTNDAHFPWRVVTEDPYEGQYCIRSGSIGNNATTTLILSHEAGSADTISFYYKVSSEGNWDKLHFYIDNQEKNDWSGTVNWTKASYPVTAGLHTYKWTYTKDSSQSQGSDCAWIDFVSLPSPRIMAGTAGPDVTACSDDEVQIIGYAIYYNNLQWTTSGDGSFDDASIATPLYTPGPQDIANGQATLTLTITGDGHTITDEMTVFINERTEIYENLFGQHYCAIDEPQPISVGINGEYVSFQWLTDGDGTFEDASALETTYTPGLNDINNGVTLTAFAVSPGCGSVTFDYPFEMNPMPSIEFHEPNLTVQVCQGQNRPWEYSAEGFIEGLMTIDVDGVTVNIIEGQPFEFPTATLEPGFHTLTLNNLSNGYCSDDQEFSFEIEVIETPVLTVDQTEITICEGEHAQFEFTVTGGDTSNPVFVLTGDAPYDFYWISGHQHTFMVSPNENTQIHLSQITAWASGEGDNCPNDIDITLTINVNPMMQRPEISGDTELDVRLTPTTRYTVTNDVAVGFSIEPEEAGTLVPANDGKTVDITWSDSYKGEVTLTAMPTAECYTSEGLLTINVKNSTGINESGVSASLYPNPTNGNVTIEAEGLQRLTVVNELGQVVYDAEVSNDTEMLNMSQFGTGVYMIRIYTENGMGVKRVSVIR